MGVYNDLLQNAKTFDTGNGDGREGVSRAIVRELRGLQHSRGGDAEYPAGTEGGDVNEQVLVLSQVDPSVSDNASYTLTLAINYDWRGETEPLPLDASPAEVEAAIYAANPGLLPEGRLSVSGTSIDSGEMIFTFSGFAGEFEGDFVARPYFLWFSAVLSDGPTIEITHPVGEGPQVQTIGQFTNDIRDGYYRLTFSIDAEGGPYSFDFTRPYNATADDLQTAINQAANGVVPGYADYDIEVEASEESLVDGDFTITFSGESVAAGDHGLIQFEWVGNPDFDLHIDITDQAAVREVQEIAPFEAEAGYYQIRFNGLRSIDETTEVVTSPSIPYNASLSEIQQIIDEWLWSAVGLYDYGDLQLSGSAPFEGTLTLTFSGPLAGFDQPLAEIVGIPALTVYEDSAGAEPANAEFMIHQFPETVNSGGWQLRLYAPDGSSYGINLSYGDDKSDLQSAIDGAFAEYEGYTEGDIEVTGHSGSLNGGDWSITYNGSSVAGHSINQPTFLDIDLDPPVTVAISVEVAGRSSADELQVITVYANLVTAGTFTMALRLPLTDVVLENIPYDVTDTSLQGLIDSALAEYPGYTSEDILVNGGPLTWDYFHLYYSGSLGARDINEAIILDNQLVTSDFDTAVTETVKGSFTGISSGGGNPALGILVSTGIVAFDGDTLVAGTRGPRGPLSPSNDLIRVLAREAAVAADDEELESTILRLARVA